MADHNTNATNKALIGVTAAVVGAVATAAVLTMADKKKRQKLAQQLKMLKKATDKTVHSLKSSVSDNVQEIPERAHDLRDTIDDIAEKNGVSNTTHRRPPMNHHRHS